VSGQLLGNPGDLPLQPERGPGAKSEGAAGLLSPHYKWVALSNTTIGVLMASMNSSIVLIALPDIFKGIKLDPLLASNTVYFLWLLMGYLLVTTVLVVSFGRLGDMYGRVKMYNLGFAVFTLFSVMLSVTWMTGADGALWLIAMRVAQGVGGAFLLANSSAILTDAFPEDQRGLAIGINSVAAIAGSFIGLIMGGLFGGIEWRLVFLVSVPFGLFGTVWAYLKLHDTGTRRPARIDWWGNLTFAAGLVLVLVGITYGIEPYGKSSMGWGSPRVLSELIAGVVVLGLFAVIETKVADPMFRLHLFRIRAFTAGNFASLLSSLGRGGLFFLLIIWLQGIWLPEHGYSFAQTPLWAGIYMVPLTIGFLVAGPLSGLASDRFGARPFATGGMVGAAASFGLLELLPVDFSYTAFAALLLLNGLAMGLFAAPNRAGIMNSLPPDERGAGAGMATTFQNAAQVLSIGIYFSLVVIGLTSRLPQSLLAGLTSHGVPRATAESVAHLPPVGVLFAAFLGFNPVQSLLGPSGVLARLPAADRATLLGHGFFPHLISQPFGDGLHTAFDFSLAVCLIAAVASWLRGAKYHHAAAPVAAAPIGEAVHVRSTPVPLAVPSPANGAGAGPRGTVPVMPRPEDLAAELAGWRRRALEGPGPLVVALSASYGAKGGLVGPILAQRLGLPFLDRAIPAAVAAELAVPLDEALAYDDQASHGLGRFFGTMSRVVTPYGAQRLDDSDAVGDAQLVKMTTELVLWRLAATTGGVVLGRASTLVLANYPNAFRVRLDGPVEARARWAMTYGHLDEETARRAQRETDRVHEAYVRHLYGTSMTDPSHFHLYVDATVLDTEACADLLENWVKSRVPGGVLRDRRDVGADNFGK
jgi:MFS family permease